MDNNYTFYIVLAAIVLVGALVIFYLKNANTKPKKATKSGLDLNVLFRAIGGKENLQAVSANGSKITFTLNDIKTIDQQALKALGASGIVASKDHVTVIFGKVSEVLAQEIAQNL